MKRINPEIRAARELLKDGFIDIKLWRRRLVKDKTYYQGELVRCQQSLKKLQSERERLNSLEYPELP